MDVEEMFGLGVTGHDVLMIGASLVGVTGDTIQSQEWATKAGRTLEFA